MNGKGKQESDDHWLEGVIKDGELVKMKRIENNGQWFEVSLEKTNFNALDENWFEYQF